MEDWDEEQQGLLSPNLSDDNAGLVESSDPRDLKACQSVEHLHLVVVVAAATICCTLIVTMVDCFTFGSVPVWVLFLFLWIGQAGLIVVLLQSLKLVLQAMITKGTKEKFSQKWHQANERRIPLVQFTVFNVLWIFGVSIAVTITELIALLYTFGVVPLYSVFLIPYVILGIAISNSLVCRTSSGPVIFNLICILGFCILLNIRLIQGSSIISWNWVFSPIFSLLGFWWIGCWVVILKHLCGQVSLKQYQIEAVSLYLISLSLGLFGLAVVLMLLNGISALGYFTSGIVVTVFFVSVTLFFIGLGQVVVEELKLVVVRKGSERPTNIRRLSHGGWDRDETLGFVNYVLLGEVEFVRDKNGDKVVA